MPYDKVDRALSRYQAEKVREYYEQGATQNRLAIMFEVSKQTIKNIVQMRTYKEGF
jgi:DNA-binding XRE family transcriptional regulator|tara:strand:- start:495 stop:662 length:168 start_codon:yes stop_codon:yes gene_type:complete